MVTNTIIPNNQPTLPPISRQMLRRKAFELMFLDVSKQYKEPRAARRKLAWNLSKKSWEAYRNSNVQS